MIPGKKSICTLQKYAQSQLSDGSTSESWTDVCTFKAVVAPISAAEKQNFDKDTVFSIKRLMIPYKAFNDEDRDEVTSDNRIKVGTTIYEIKQIINYDDRHYEILVQDVT